LNTADDDPPPVVLEPLTRRNRAGDLYVRPADIERQVLAALPLSRDELRRRAAVSDRGSPEYLKEESLVHLLRHHHRHGDEGRVSDLSAALVRRTTRIIRKRLWSLGNEALEEGYAEVVTRFFGKILDVASDRADFYEVRFWVALERLCIQVFGLQLVELERRQKEVSFAQVPGYEDDDGDEAEPETKGVRLSEADKRRTSSPSSEEPTVDSDRAREARRIAITQLEEPFRSAYMLRHYHGWPIEDQDPNVPTISRHFRKTSRTIRNWLEQAEEVLANWRGGRK
jgi:DNA-directed RNA polymerase specialized sigma24 family protein